MTIFDFIRKNISIADVVAKHVSLRRLGAYWKGSCPFHMETDASFTISPSKGIFYCFGCHVSGDVVAFMAKISNLSQFEAVQSLIQSSGLTVPEGLLVSKEKDTGANAQTDLALRACKVFANWAHEQLLQHREALQYLLQRGISQASMERFCMGFFPLPEQENTEKLMAFAQKHGVLVQNLSDAGIVTQQQNGLWSPFAGRIIFPIRSADGKYIAFGGRVFLPDDGRPKYYNSKESPLFHKGSVLFGFDLAKQEIRNSRVGFLVEGYMDCIMMAQYGFAGTFATLGTACTAAHIKLAEQHLTTLFVVYDADRAGLQAVLRLAKICWSAEVELKVIELPIGHDPASFLSGGGDLAPLIKSAQGIFEFFLQKNSEQFVGKSLTAKAGILREVIGIVCQLTDMVKRDLLMLEMARVFQVPLATLQKQVSSAAKSTSFEQVAVPEAVPTKRTVDLGLEQQILFTFLTAQKEGLPGFELQGNTAQFWSPEVNDLFNIWQETATMGNVEHHFDLFLSALSEEQKTLTLKGLLLCEQILDCNLFMRLQKELEKRQLRQLILHAREHAVDNDSPSVATMDMLQRISHLSKKIKVNVMEREK